MDWTTIHDKVETLFGFKMQDFVINITYKGNSSIYDANELFFRKLFTPENTSKLNNKHDNCRKIYFGKMHMLCKVGF